MRCETKVHMTNHGEMPVVSSQVRLDRVISGRKALRSVSYLNCGWVLAAGTASVSGKEGHFMFAGRLGLDIAQVQKSFCCLTSAVSRPHNVALIIRPRLIALGISQRLVPAASSKPEDSKSAGFHQAPDIPSHGIYPRV